MLRVVAALLLAAAALAAVDLRDLVDAVFNTTSPLERFAPTYVFEIDGCRVLVYISNFFLKSSPWTAYQTRDNVYYSHNKTARPLTSAEVERLLDALFQAFGPSARAEVEVRLYTKLWCTEKRGEGASSETLDPAQLAERVLKAAERVVKVAAGGWMCTKMPPDVSHTEAKDAAQPAEEANNPAEAEGAGTEVEVLTNSTWHCEVGFVRYVRINEDIAQLVERLRRAAELEFVTSVAVEGTDFTLQCTKKRFEVLYVDARSAAQLAEEVRRATGAYVYLGDADAHEALKRGTEPAAYLRQVAWRRGDIAAYFVQDAWGAILDVKTVNLSAAVEALKKAREMAGEVWNSVYVILWHGPYFVVADEEKNLTEAAQMLENELREVWKPSDKEKKAVWRIISIYFDNELGPIYVVVAPPNATAPDEATAERIIRRFVELSGFCKSPLVVEFASWPKSKEPPTEHSPPLWPYAVAIATVAAINIGFVVFARRRK